jgi:hypothetical protein
MAETTGSIKAQSGMVTGLFRDRESAERAYGSLTERGYGQDDALHRHWEREPGP